MNSNLTGKSGLPRPFQPTGSGERSDVLWQSRSLLLIASAITVALMFLPYSNFLLYPLRLFVTFIHESGHAFAAVITGGDVASLTVKPNGEGVTMTRDAPWWNWLVLSGGYLGTTVFGALLLQVGRLNRWQNAGRATLYAAAAFLLIVTLLWGHSNLFTLVAGIVLAALLGGLARISAPRVANFIASFLAVQCCLNALGDLRILLYLTANTRGDNDAVFMQQNYALPAVFWAALWAVMAVIILALALRSYWRGTEARIPRAVV